MTKPENSLSVLISAMKKYKYAILVILLGSFLLLLPNSTQEERKATETEGNYPDTYESYGKEVEARLEQVLSNIQGVGQVQVVLTMKQGSTTHYLYDTQRQKESSGDSLSEKEEQKTVLISSGSSYDEATVTTVDYPLFQGALIICEGGDRPEIQLTLVEAVSALTNLRSDKISVVKMK